MKKTTQITKELLEEKFMKFVEQQRQIEKKVDELGVLYNKLEGAKESIQILLTELDAPEIKKDEPKE
jgi:hypothetical protein